MPESTLNIGTNAFAACTSLVSVVIPNNVTNIGNYSFGGCSSLTAFAVEEANQYYKSVDGVLFNKSRNVIIQYPPGMQRQLSYVIPESVKWIGDWSFRGCTKLTNIIIGNHVIDIGSGAFGGCVALTSCMVPDVVHTIGGNAFLGCIGLTTVTIGNGVTEIADDAFEGCWGLKNVKFGNSVASIGKYAFSGCSGLTSLTIPKSVTSIGDYAFGACIGLNDVTFEGDDPDVGSYIFNNANPNVYFLPDTVGWDFTYVFSPVLLWNPTASPADPRFGITNGRFGFNISGTPNIKVVVEEFTNLDAGPWVAVSTNTLIGGSSYFVDPGVVKNTGDYYRFRTP